MRKLLLVAFSLAVVGGSAATASAGTITFDLSCIISGPSTCSPSVSFGTLSISDTSTDGEFDLVVDLVGNAINKVHSLYLNFAPGLTGFSFDTANDDGVVAVENGLQADGFTLGLFDLRIPDPPPGSLDFEPYMNTLVITGIGIESLTENAFNDVISGNGLLYVAVHIGNIDGTNPGLPGEDSVWVGNSTGPRITSTTPEPGLLVLLGTGLLGVFVATRRPRKRA